VLRVGLTGGIGSGKSEVSRRLAALGAVIIDADQLARDVVEPGTPGYDAVVATFGPGVVAPDGGLDRAALARVVFADEQARRSLEAIVHPLVRAEGARLEQQAAARDPAAVVVHDIPLLVETGQTDVYDVVVVVDAPDEVRLQRLVEQRGMSPQEAAARLAAQASREERLALADLVIDNSGSLAELDEAVSRVWAELRQRAARSAR
jgi:dephospho-CoA kinase